MVNKITLESGGKLAVIQRVDDRIRMKLEQPGEHEYEFFADAETGGNDLKGLTFISNILVEELGGRLIEYRTMILNLMM